METQALLKYLLPEEIFNYFDFVKIEEKNGKLYLSLDEKPDKPIEYKDKDLLSKGFAGAVEIQDFPLRGKAVYLRVRRRKWQDKSTGKIYTRKWHLTAKGTGYTEEFAAFLKELLR